MFLLRRKQVCSEHITQRLWCHCPGNSGLSPDFGPVWAMLDDLGLSAQAHLHSLLRDLIFNGTVACLQPRPHFRALLHSWGATWRSRRAMLLASLPLPSAADPSLHKHLQSDLRLWWKRDFKHTGRSSGIQRDVGFARHLSLRWNSSILSLCAGWPCACSYNPFWSYARFLPFLPSFNTTEEFLLASLWPLFL